MRKVEYYYDAIAAESDEQGLRSRKKIQQRATLLVAAANLFSEKGVDRTLMEEMAQMCEISTKTVYNYFPNKQAIIIDLIRYDRVNMRTKYEKAIDKNPSDLIDTIINLIDADISGVISEDNKRLWRELLAAELTFALEFPEEHKRNRKMFTDYVALAIKRYEIAGLLSPDFDQRAALDMVYALLAFNFRNYVCSVSSTLDEVRLHLAAQVRLLVNGWLAQKANR